MDCERLASVHVKNTSTISTSEARAVTPRVRTVHISTSRRLMIAAVGLTFGSVLAIAPSTRAQGGYPTKLVPQATYAAPQAAYPALQSAPHALSLAPSIPLTHLTAPLQLQPSPTVPLTALAGPQMIHSTPQAAYAAPQTTYAAPQAYASGQLASPQSPQPCACYYPQGFCPFPQGNCAFPRGNCAAPCANCISPQPSAQWPAGSSQLGSEQARGQATAPFMIGD